MTKGTSVLSRIRHRLTYANVMSTMAVFIALGGSSYAAFTVNGDSIKNRSIRAKKVRHNTLTGWEIKESSLGRVDRAKRADTLDGVTASDLKIKCPADTFPVADVCVERDARAPASYHSAINTCLTIGTPAAPGRRLPTHGELVAALSGATLAGGGELTSDIYPSASAAGQVDVLYVTDRVGSVALTPDTGAGAKAFRCVTDPLN